MPTYDYQCENCCYEFEEWQSFNDDKLKICPECNQKSLIRLIGCPFVVIKQEVKTLGQLADANSKKFGKAECQERELKGLEAYEKAKEAVYGKKKEGIIPWWRSGGVEGLKKSEKPIQDDLINKYKNVLHQNNCGTNENAEPPENIRSKKRDRAKSRSSP